MLESGVRDLRVAEREFYQVGATTQILESVVRDLCAIEMESTQLGATAQVVQTGVRDEWHCRLS